MPAIEPTKPQPQDVVIGGVYEYQGRRFKDSLVRIISDVSPYPAMPWLCYAVVLTKKGADSSVTFGCDPRWLCNPGEKSAFKAYDDALKKFNKGIPAAKSDEPIGLSDPDDEPNQGIIWEM